MAQKKHFLLIGVMILVGSLLVSCTGFQPEPTATNVPTDTALPQPTSTIEVAETEASYDWDLVFISNSIGFGVPELYAHNIEQDTGKMVQVHDYAIGSLNAVDVLHDLQHGPDSVNNNSLRSLREDVKEAEVIVFFADPEGDPSVTSDFDNCIYGRAIPPENCGPETYGDYSENLKAIYAEIFTLRDGKPTIIRAIDLYNPMISRFRQNNMEAECTHCQEIFNNIIQEAAAAYNIPTVSLYDAFNGPDHDQDPREKGYIGYDGLHTSPEGRQLIADLLSEAGYEPVEPHRSEARATQETEERITFTLTANPDKDPITASTAIGEIKFTVLQPPPNIEIVRTVSTPQGLAAIFKSSKDMLCWSTTGMEWECTSIFFDTFRIFTSGDHLYVPGLPGILRFSWVRDSWEKDILIEDLSYIDQAMFNRHGALAANSTTIMYSHDGLHFMKAEQGPNMDLLPEVESRPCHPLRSGSSTIPYAPMVLVTEESFLALTPAHPDNWLREPVCEPLLWSSDDGSVWSLISETSPFGETSYIHNLLQLEDRFVALGGQGINGGTVWFSDDGLTWRMADVDMEDSGAIAVGDIGWVLTGESSLWVSKDGADWHGPYTLPEDLKTGFFPPSMGIWSDTIFGGSMKNPVLGKITHP